MTEFFLNRRFGRITDTDYFSKQGSEFGTEDGKSTECKKIRLKKNITKMAFKRMFYPSKKESFISAQGHFISYV